MNEKAFVDIRMFHICIRMYSNWYVFSGVLVKIFLKMIVFSDKIKDFTLPIKMSMKRW